MYSLVFDRLSQLRSVRLHKTRFYVSSRLNESLYYLPNNGELCNPSVVLNRLATAVLRVVSLRSHAFIKGVLRQLALQLKPHI